MPEKVYFEATADIAETLARDFDGNLECAIGAAVEAQTPPVRNWWRYSTFAALLLTMVAFCFGLGMQNQKATQHKDVGEKRGWNGLSADMQKLMLFKSNLNRRFGDYGGSYLHQCVHRNENIETFEKLVVAGANINLQRYAKKNHSENPNLSGDTPLMLAIREHRYDLAVKLLEKFPQIDPNISNAKGRTAISLALFHQEQRPTDLELNTFVLALQNRTFKEQ